MENITESEKEVTPEEESKKGSSLFNDLIHFLSSIKLTVYLFFTLAVASIIGTLIEQGKDPGDYIKEYGDQVYWWFNILGFTDLYHSKWFSGLLAFLCLNAMACLYRRFPPTWKSIRRDKVEVSLDYIKNLKEHSEFKVKSTFDKTKDNVIDALKDRHYKVKVLNSGNDISIYGTKGMIGRLGSHMAHLGVLILMFGALLGSFAGFKDFGAAIEGEKYFVSQGDFYINIDKFWIEYYENGAVSGFYSKITVIDKEQEVLSKTIRVNDPLQYKGIWFYQASYGDSWNKIEKARIVIKDKNTNEEIDNVILDWQKEYTLSDKNLKLKLTEFVSDFAYDAEKKMVYAKSGEHNNPAVKIDVYQGDELKGSQWIFYEYPDLIPSQIPDYKFELKGYSPKKYTGLQIASDPGVNIVWLGSGLLMIGLILSSFIFHRRLWIKLIPSQNGLVVHIGGNTNKNHFDFNKEIGKLINNIEKET